MTMRRQAPGFFKPLANLPFLSALALMLAAIVGLPPLLARAESPNLPDGWVYDKVLGRPIAGKQLRAALPLKQVLAFDQTATPSAASNLADVIGTSAEEALAPRAVAASYAATETEMPPATGVTESIETAISGISGALSTTPNSQTRQIGMFVLLLTTLSAVTLLLWRHYRRDDASPRRIGRRI